MKPYAEMTKVEREQYDLVHEQVQSTVGALARVVYDTGENIKIHIKKSDELEKIAKQENDKISKTQERLELVIFGDEKLGLIGMQTMVAESHALLTEAKTAKKLMGGLATGLQWFLGIVSAIVVIKTIIGGLIAFLSTKP